MGALFWPPKYLGQYFIVFLLLGFAVPLAGSHPAMPPSSQVSSQTQSEDEIYSRARSVIDLTREELLKSYPAEMRDVEFDENSEILNSLLEKVGARVETLFRDFPNTLSKEQVRRELLNDREKVTESQTQDFVYSAGSDVDGAWRETRTNARGGQIQPAQMSRSSFLTSGFVSSSIYFQPRHQHGCRFRYLGKQRSKPYAYVIAFAQRPVFADVVGVFSGPFVSGEAHLLYQGFAWVDPETYQIVRMRTDLLAPRNDILLADVTSELSFGEVRFESVPESFWLPKEVIVTIKEANGSLFRNRHRYADYKLFTVGAQDKIATPPIKK